MVALDVDGRLLEPVAALVEADVPCGGDIELARRAAVERRAEHVEDALGPRLAIQREVLSGGANLERGGDELALDFEDLRHRVGGEVGVSDVLHVCGEEVAECAECGGDGLRLAETVEDAASVEEVRGLVGVAVVVPVPEHLVHAVAEAEHVAALEVGGLLPFGDDLSGARVPAPFGDPELAVLAVRRGGALPLAVDVAQEGLFRLALPGVGVGLAHLRRVDAAVAMAVADVDVGEVAAQHVLAGGVRVDAGHAGFDGPAVGGDGFDDLAEGLVVGGVFRPRGVETSVDFVVDLEGGECREAGHEVGHAAAPLRVGSARALGLVAVELHGVHQARERHEPVGLGLREHLLRPGPAAVFAVAARAQHPVERVRIVSDPDEAQARELLVADVAAAMDVDGVGAEALLLRREGGRLEADDVARGEGLRLGEALDVELDRVGPGLREGQLRRRGGAVEAGHRLHREGALGAVRGDDLRRDFERARLAEPARGGQDDPGLLAGVEDVADGRKAQPHGIGALRERHLGDVRLDAEVAEVEDDLVLLRVVPGAPVREREALERDGLRQVGGHRDLEALPDFVAPVDAKLALLAVRALEDQLHADLVGTLPSMPGEALRRAGDLALGLRELQAPIGKGARGKLRRDPQGLACGGGARRALGERLPAAGGGDPVVLLPRIRLGIADVAGDEQTLRRLSQQTCGGKRREQQRQYYFH